MATRVTAVVAAVYACTFDVPSNETRADCNVSGAVAVWANIRDGGVFKGMMLEGVVAF